MRRRVIIEIIRLTPAIHRRAFGIGIPNIKSMMIVSNATKVITISNFRKYSIMTISLPPF
jgi:hypothetical protein